MHQAAEYEWPQIFYVAQQFATEGDSEMRQAMYSAFDLLRFGEAGASAATSLIHLDPLEGFVFAIDRFDTSSSEDDWWMVGSLITDLEDRVGKAEAERLIANAVETHTSVDNVIGAYRRYEEEQRHASQRSDSERHLCFSTQQSGLSAAVKRHETERAICAPAIHLEIVVKRENVTRSKLRSHVNQAGIGKIDRLILVFFQNALNWGRATRKLNRNLERAIDDILKNGFGCPRKPSRQITSFCYDGFARRQRPTNASTQAA